MRPGIWFLSPFPFPVLARSIDPAVKVQVKICGIRDPAVALFAADRGADAIGLVFTESSRRVNIETARLIRDQLPPFVSLVTVFRDESADDVDAVVRAVRPHLVQYHGLRDTDDCIRAAHPAIKAFSLGSADDLAIIDRFIARCPWVPILVDASRPGSGQGCRWDLAGDLACRSRLILAGGLSPENVADGIREVRPYAVDVSSGLEQVPGVKDPDLIDAFLRRVEEAGRRYLPRISSMVSG